MMTAQRLLGHIAPLLLTALSVMVLLGASSAGAETGTAVGRHGALKVKGGQIVDSAGQPVVLRGMSLFWSQWEGEYYNRDVVRWLRDDWNATVIRAAIGVEPGGYIENPEREMAKAEAVIDAAIELGVYVIVDWHAHQPHPEQAKAFFSRIAARYGHHPNLIYEPYNEPLPEHGWAEVIKPYHQQVIAAIRAHDPDNLILVGTRSWSQDVDEAAADPLQDRNIAYVLHFYAGTHRQPLRDKAKRALERGAALFVSEWGTSEANGSDNLDEAETRLWWDFMEAHKLSYVNWSVADKDETSAALRPGASPNGGWSDAELSPSGRLVRERLRRMNPRAKP
jgi:endoglucanase